MIHGKVNRKRRRGRPKQSYSGNIAKWTGGSIIEQIMRDSRDRPRRRKLVRGAVRRPIRNDGTAKEQVLKEELQL